MSDHVNTGGPAFPIFPDTATGHASAFPGMTLRDYFATKAMQSFIADVGWKSDQQCFDEIAEGAYRQADAMLKARQE
jgi:hypothetical protein